MTNQITRREAEKLTKLWRDEKGEGKSGRKPSATKPAAWATSYKRVEK